MDYERLATTALEQVISKTERLKPWINKGDKEPSFDGNIYIYERNTTSKKDIKRVPVQVKGKGVCKNNPTLTIKYPVSVIDLKNYLKNSGVMFFVVYIDKDTGDTIQIYYASLVPFKIKELLRYKTNNTQSISITFNKFPNDKKEITDLLLSFYYDAQKQSSFINSEIPTIEELIKQEQLACLSFSIPNSQGKLNLASIPRRLEGKDLYIYADIKGGLGSVPVKCISQISHIQMNHTVDIPVSVNGVIYYTGLVKTITSDKILYRIGSSVTLSIPNTVKIMDNNTGIELKIVVELKGTLKEQINALKFLIPMLNEKRFEIGDANFPVNFSETELKKLGVDEYPEILDGYKRILSVLEKLNVKKDLPLNDFTDEDYRKLDILVGAIESEKPVKCTNDDLPCIVKFDVGGLHLLMICQKQDDGSYKLWDYFNKSIDVFIVDNGEEFTISQYSIMKSDDFVLIDNLRLQSVINDFKRIKPQKYIVENGNHIMLEMLKAYDKEPNVELLEAAKQMCSWLETEKQYLGEEVLLINSLQITKRERELNIFEKPKLYEIANTSENVFSRIGALILLNESDEVEKLFNVLPQKQKDDFSSLPIFKLYLQSKED